MDSDKDKTNQEISKTPKEIDQQNTKEILDETQPSNADLFKFLNTYNSLEIDNLKKNIADEVLNQIKNQRHKEWINKENMENDNLKEIKKIIASYNSQSNITNDEINKIEQKIFELLAYTGCSFLFNEKTQNITINFIKYDMNLNIKISIDDLLLILDLLFSNFKNVFTDFLYLTKK